MSFQHWRRLALVAALACACSTAVSAEFRHPDHYEFDASLDAPFRADAGRWPFALRFDYPGAGEATSVAWVVDVLDRNGRVVASQHSMAPIRQRHIRVDGRWNGRDAANRPLAAGYYTLRLRAVPSVDLPSDRGLSLRQRVDQAFAAFADELVEQAYDVMVGQVPAARMTPMAPLPRARDRVVQGVVASTGGLPYTIYYGNMHSQTNHSDGGAPVASCGGSEVPQGGSMGPADAYAMMQTQAGGDFLLASEHNHMYDGSTGTNSSAVPANAIALFDSGKQAAADYRAAHSGFMALYGLEWGVISNGGHLNILNPDALAEWEYNGSGQLIGEVLTPKSDYVSLYATMAQRGWVGQFNHPSSSQFIANSVAMGYDANGDAVMVLAEVLNSSAFSTNTSETETSRSSYVGAWNKLLEAGYHVAPSSDQDNHCANWGLSFTNRTGVLMPNGVALSEASFLDALRARRAFATEDKAGQLVLTGDGNMMGGHYANSGSLTLDAGYASSNGQTVQRVQFFEGVPGRKGTVTQLSEGSGTYTFTPADGEHFYYALVTQANGLRLWSAPIWISQNGSAPTDTTPPTVSASETGSSGTITFSATASDNIGVASVEFLVDGVSVGSDAASPYSLSFDSTSLSNGSHTLVAKAYDAAGNVGTSTTVSFNVSNVVLDTTAPTVSANETGTSGSISLSATASDNVGVTKVEFLVDGVLKGSDTSSPYALALDSTTLANGSHTLVAKAYDAAGNVGTSTGYAFSVNNVVAGTERIVNGGFESGTSPWKTSSGVITNDASYAAHGGSWKAWLNGYGRSYTDTAYQTVSIPSGATNATLTFWLRVDTDETTTTQAYDTLKLQLRSTSNKVLATMATYSNLDAGTSYVQKTFDVTAYKGQTIRVYFLGVEGSQVATSFLLDDVSLMTR